MDGPSLSPGNRLGPYEILAKVGAGGMGEVYRARDTRLGRTVAVKVLPTELSANAERKHRFEREARAISQLSHPHVCALFDVGQQDGIAYLVLEYLEGETLERRLQRGRLALPAALQIAIEVADALAWSHSHGIAHRDLKPSNVMLTANGAKLLDFGLATDSPLQNLEPAGSAATRSITLTASGAILGTYPYMSPEQAEGKPSDGRSDIFALGTLIYEMVAGRPAFTGDNPTAVLSAVLKTDPPPIGGHVPARLERLLQACLAKSPGDRWQSAQDAKMELQWIAGSHPDAPVVDRRRQRFTLAGVAALAIALVATVVWGLDRHGQGAPAARLRSSLLPPGGMSYQPYAFALSPDGARLAFVGVATDGQTSLLVRSLSSGATQSYPGTANAANPFWSADSRRLGFFAEGRLQFIDLNSGSVHALAQAPLGMGGAWNQEDVIVFAPGVAGPLLRVSAAGGPAVPVTSISGTGGHRWPSFLPDGRHFTYCEDRRTANNPRGNGIFLGSLDSDRARLISAELSCDTQYAASHLLYVRDRSLMAQPFDPRRGTITAPPVSIIEQEIETDPAFGRSAFSFAQDGALVFQSSGDVASRLVWFDPAGKAVGHINETGMKDPRLSPDGRRLAVSSDDAHNGSRVIRVYDLDRGVSTRLTDSGQEEYPAWSSDGKSIVYAARREGGVCMCRVAADASSPPVSLLEGSNMPNDWHGRWIVYMNFEKGFPWLWTYDVDTRGQRPLHPGAEGQFSPDGKWMAFTEGVPGHDANVYVSAFPGPGPRVQISNLGGGQAQWSRDGKRLYYMEPDRRLMVVELEARNGSLKASAPRLVFQTRITAAHTALFQYTVAPDGRFLINSLPTESPGPLTLLTEALSPR